MKQSIKEYHELTGFHRQVIAKRLADLTPVSGANGAKLYESTEALPLIYKTDSLEAARARQADAAAQLARTRDEILQRERIPLDIAMETLDQVMQAMAATLKAQVGRVMTLDTVNEVFTAFRDIPKKLGWEKKTG